MARGRKSGTLNTPVSVRRAAAAAYKNRAPGVTQKIIATRHHVGVSTLKKWIDESNETADEPEEELPFGANTVYREKPSAPTYTWLHTATSEGQQTPTVVQVVEQLRQLEPERIQSKSYGAQRKIAERLLDAVVRDKEKYNPIVRSVGVERIPRRALGPRCHCTNCDDMCPTRQEMTECVDGTCRLGKLCSNREIQQGTSVSFLRCTSSGRGHGVVAQEEIEKGQFIQEYVGIVIDQGERARLHDRTRGLYVMELANGFYVDAMHWGNESRLLNHSHAPNCRAELWWVNGEPRVGIFASKRIRPRTELAFNYGSDYYIDACMCRKCERKRSETN